MQTTGTNSENINLTVPETDDEFNDALLKAVNEGNEDEINRLMSIEAPAPSSDEKEEDQDVSAEDTSTTENGSDQDTTDTAQVSDANKEDNPYEARFKELTETINTLRAQTGRIGSLQSQLAQLQAQQEARAREDAAAAAAAQAATITSKDSKIAERIKELAEVDEATAELLRDMYGELQEARNNRVDPDELTARVTQEALQRQQQAQLQQEFTKVVTAHPDFDSIRRNPTWAAWKDTLSPAQREWAESANSSQVIEAVTQYKKYLQGGGIQQSQQESATTTVQTPAQVSATQAARDQKLTTSAKVAETPMKASGVFDADAAFKQEYARIMKEYGLQK